MRRGGVSPPFLFHYEKINHLYRRYPRSPHHHPHRVCHPRRRESILSAALPRRVHPSRYRMVSTRALVWTLSAGNHFKPQTTLATSVGADLCCAAGSGLSWIDPQRAHRPHLRHRLSRHVRVWDAGLAWNIFFIKPQSSLSPLRKNFGFFARLAVNSFAVIKYSQ